MTAKGKKTEEEYLTELTPEQFRVARQAGTERAFTGKYWDTKTPGMYHCVCCGEALFDSDNKYSSGCGWPSFTAPAADPAISTERDSSLGMERVEVTCSNCDAHLGHVFPDGPPESGGQRYCINSASLDLTERDKEPGEESS